MDETERIFDEFRKGAVALEGDGRPTEQESEEEVVEKPEEAEESLTEEEYQQEEPPKKQPKAENSKYAAARREAEARAKELEKQLEAVVKRTGYKSYEDLQHAIDTDYEEREEQWRLEAEDEGIEPEKYIRDRKNELYVADERQAARARKLVDAKAEAETAERHAKMITEMNEFKERYPNSNLTSVLNDVKFQKFAKGKLSLQSIADTYADYIDIVGEVMESSVANYESKAARSTGTASSGGAVRLTAKQWKELNEWNSSNPQNKMTPEQFSKY